MKPLLLLLLLPGILATCISLWCASNANPSPSDYAPLRHSRNLQVDSVGPFYIVDQDRNFTFTLGVLNGTVIDLDALGTANLNIGVHVNGTQGQSVTFFLGGEEYNRDNVAPYRFGPKVDFVLEEGLYTITAESRTSSAGPVVDTMTVSFAVVSSSATAQNEPKFVGEWAEIEDYPLVVGEAQGAALGSKLLVVSGFLPGLNPTEKVYSFDMSESNPSWVEMADLPGHEASTHAAHAAVGNMYYQCGGYEGRSPGFEVPYCYGFDITTNTWSSLPELPDGGRGGGSMVYVESMNALVFSMGALRPHETIDKNDTYMLELSSPGEEWKMKASSPFNANHLSAVTAMDCDGQPHYFFLGGQIEEGEDTHNVADNYEYLPEEDAWIQRRPLSKPRGHTTSSTLAYSCGYILVGGSVDSFESGTLLRTRSIDYFDIPTNTWSRIGDYPKPTKTPVCGIHDDFLYCTGGFRREGWKRRLIIPTRGQIPTSAPPTPAPTIEELPTAGGEAILKLNCGGPTINGWIADTIFATSGKALVRNRRQFTNHPTLFMYSTERRQNDDEHIAYDVAFLPNGYYRVDLYFTEKHRRGVGRKEMDVTMEGELILDNYDIYDASDGVLLDGVGLAGVPLVESVHVAVRDGNGLQIELKDVSGRNDAVVNGIAIYHVLASEGRSAAPSPPPVPVPSITPTSAPSPVPSGDPLVGVELYKVSCGGPALIDWVTDDAFTSTGRARRRGRRQFYSQKDWLVYNTERHDVGDEPLVSSFPDLPNGKYQVDFYMVDLQEKGVGRRLMDIYVEGFLVLDNYDIFDSSDGVMGTGTGAMTLPLIEAVFVTVNDDNGLQIVLEGVVDDAKVNGIVIKTA